MTFEGEILFVGVGGMGMAPLASWMSHAGYSITGYDQHLQERVRVWLDESGVRLSDFVFAEHVKAFDAVVYSSAVPREHPLLVAAGEAGVTLLRRGEMLARVAEGKRLIAVVGSHGKTTTAGMIAHGIRHCGLDANCILGGLFAGNEVSPSRFTDDEWLIAEVDESDGTIDQFSPEVSLVLNIDWDHADRYLEADDLEAAFSRLLERTRETVLLPEGMDLGEVGIAKRELYTGCAEAKGLERPPAGRFNQMNGDAATAVLSMLGSDVKTDSLSSFPGMARRQGTLHRDDSLLILEDYAHHPTEIDALIECLRGNEPERELLVVFQPHRFSRTLQFKEAFASSLSAADEVFLLPVYAAHEPSLENADSEALARAFPDGPPATLDMSLAGVESLANSISGRRAQLAFVGAGDIEDFAAAFAAYYACGSRIDDAWEAYMKARVSPDCLLRCNEPLAKKTTIRIGGSARLYAEPANLSDLRELLRAADLFSLKTFCLGRGSNLLVPDEGFDGLVIRFSAPAWRRVEALGEGRIWAAAGGRLKEICGFAAKNGLAGFEFLEGIPGAVGGALRMNAGAMGSWMFDVVERVQFIDESGVYQDLPKEAFHFGYRKVEEISRGIALGAILNSASSDSESCIRGRIDSYSNTRKESQPRGRVRAVSLRIPKGITRAS